VAARATWNPNVGPDDMGLWSQLRRSTPSLVARPSGYGLSCAAQMQANRNDSSNACKLRR